MTRRIAAIAFVVCCLSPFGAGARADTFLPPLFGEHRPEPKLVFDYHGWRVNASAAAKAQRPARTIKAITDQIDLVEHASLPPQILGFMRTVPILAEAGDSEDPDGYVRGRGAVLHVRELGDKRPILLRVLLYAYQDQALPGGAANDIARFRRQAEAERVWPKTAAMLRGDPDYFAMTASAYLAGAITREPYTRADLRKTQPDAYLWLAKLFDDGRPR